MRLARGGRARKLIPAGCRGSPASFASIRQIYRPAIPYQPVYPPLPPHTPPMSRLRSAITRTTRLGMVAAAAARVTITLPDPPVSPPEGKPAHWANDEGTLFRNPWDSFRKVVSPHLFCFVPGGLMLRGVIKGFGDFVDMIYQVQLKSSPEPLATSAERIPVHTPDFSITAKLPPGQIKATWLGHACFLLELPNTGDGKRGMRVLLDPVFSERCSPSAWVGPKRFTRVCCAVEELPEVDAVVSLSFWCGFGIWGSACGALRKETRREIGWRATLKMLKMAHTKKRVERMP